MTLTVTGRGQSATTTASQSTIAVVPASNFTAGALAVLCVSYDNSGSAGSDPYSSIADTPGNTWTPRVNDLNDPGAASAGIAGRIFTSAMTVSTLTTAHTITVSLGGITTVARAWTLFEITKSAGYDIEYITGGSNNQSTATPSITTGIIRLNDVVLGVVCREGNGTRSDDTDTTNGSWAASQQAGSGTTTSGAEIISQTKIVTAEGTQTYNPTFAAVSADGVSMWAQFHEMFKPPVLPPDVIKAVSMMRASTI